MIVEDRSAMKHPFEPLQQLSEAFQRASTRYFVVGSVASGMRGVFRSTNDIDVVCELNDAKSIQELISSLSHDFDCDLMDVPAAVARSKSFNILHKTSFTKVDIFSKLTELEIAEFERAEYLSIPNTDVKVVVATAEYIVLAKLSWYVLGNRISERQLEDIRNVIKVNRLSLDMNRLSTWAERLSLRDDLNVVLSDRDSR